MGQQTGKYITAISENKFASVHHIIQKEESIAETGFRLGKNYAGIGYTYDETRDAFIPPKPYDSWILNETTCLWEAPVAYPNDGQQYTWNEELGTWDLITE